MLNVEKIFQFKLCLLNLCINPSKIWNWEDFVSNSRQCFTGNVRWYPIERFPMLPPTINEHCKRWWERTMDNKDGLDKFLSLGGTLYKQSSSSSKQASNSVCANIQDHCCTVQCTDDHYSIVRYFFQKKERITFWNLKIKN